MNYSAHPYRIFPLGDSAITIDFGNLIDETINKEVIARFGQLKDHPFPGMIEAVPAYSSLTVHYDVLTVRKTSTGGRTAFETVKQQLEEKLQEPVEQNEMDNRLVKIPVCYEDEFAPDLHYLATSKNISTEEVIQIHTAKTYKVYMLGFLPGFAYMGEVDEQIAIARKPQPQNVKAGGVGIAGKQTGIYPLASPGGWQIIGRTPVKIAPLNPPEAGTSEEPICLLHPGDSVQFYSITKNEFYEILKLPSPTGEGLG